MTVDVAARVPLGRSDVRVSRLAFGGAPIGGLFDPVTDEQAAGALQAAWDEGVRYVDTAPHYGAGLSEQRVGRFLAGKPESEWVLSTKVGRLLVPREDAGRVDGHGGPEFSDEPPLWRVFDFSRDGVLRSVEESLARLGLDRVDVLYIHDPDDHWQQAVDEAYPVLHALRDEGVVGAIGAGMNQTAMLERFVRETDVDCVLVAGRYTLLEQGALSGLLPACTERGASVVAAGVLNSGLLAAPRPGATYNYAPADTVVLDRARRLDEVCARHGVPLRRAALHFPLGHPAVATLLVGARTADEARDNARALADPPPAAMWQDLVEEGLLQPDVPVPP